MKEPICPHCGKITLGIAKERNLYILVVCDKCEVILGVLPKYYQKCTWKLEKEENNK